MAGHPFTPCNERGERKLRIRAFPGGKAGHVDPELRQAGRAQRAAGALDDLSPAIRRLPMRYNPLGRTGLLVSELCLGTMTFGGGGGTMWSKIGQLGQSEADAMLRAAIDAGVNFLDTADVYAEGRSEEITGQAIRNLGVPRDEIVVATKGFGATGQGPNARGASRYHLIDACKTSLKRLQLDHVDLYQIHGFDPVTPMEETLRALDTLVQHGHVRYVGVSNWAAWQIAKALGIAERLGLHRPASLQAYYSLVGRDLERKSFPCSGRKRWG
jgi:aryl-alcohol dehydrogenase-like predicted oxidoreductase